MFIQYDWRMVSTEDYLKLKEKSNKVKTPSKKTTIKK